jgi:penicillin-binding protein activator
MIFFRFRRTLGLIASAVPSRYLASAIGFAALLLAGCGNHREVRFVEAKGVNQGISLDQVNIQDLDLAANQLVASLFGSGLLERAPQQPVVIRIPSTRVGNGTQLQIDTDALLGKVRLILLQSGKVVTVEVPNHAEPGSGAGAYYALDGKITVRRASEGSVSQVTNVFQLSLLMISNGQRVWENEAVIVKQGRRPSVGF